LKYHHDILFSAGPCEETISKCLEPPSASRKIQTSSFLYDVPNNSEKQSKPAMYDHSAVRLEQAQEGKEKEVSVGWGVIRSKAQTRKCQDYNN
jgi:hypothetical protein